MANPIASLMTSRVTWEMGYWTLLWGMSWIRIGEMGRLPTAGGIIPRAGILGCIKMKKQAK